MSGKSAFATVRNSLSGLAAAAVLGVMGAPGTACADAEDPPDSRPYLLNLTYTLERWENLRGGLAQGSVYLDKIDLSAGANLSSWVSSGRLQVFARVFFANGHAVSGGLVGDIQGVSNLETERATRLFETWVEWEPYRSTNMRLGLYDLNSEFDTLPTAQLFLNASQGIGKDVSQSGRMGPSIYPVTSLGSRTQWNVTPDWSLKVAVLDGVPGDPRDSDATAVNLSGKDGALVIGELAYIDDTVHKVALGSWHYTSRFDVAGSGQDGEPTESKRGNSGVYGLIDLSLLQADDEPTSRLDAFIRLGYADPDVNRFDFFAGGGVVYKGVIGTNDHLGLAFAMARQAGLYQRAAALLYSGQTPAAETDIEASWAFPVGSWLTLQPDLQYIINPNIDPAVRNDLVFGFRVQVSLDPLKMMAP